MGQRHVCTFRHAQRAAYRTAISAAQILVLHTFVCVCMVLLFLAIQWSTLHLFLRTLTASSSSAFVVCHLVLYHTAVSVLSGT